MARKSVLFILVLVIIGGLLSMACDPQDPAHCSQGFWKNKGYKIFVEEGSYWYDPSELYAKGPGMNVVRDAKTAELNQMFWWADQFCLD